MKAFEKELPEGKFLRIHKSHIINLERIDKYNSQFVEIDRSKIPVSRNKKNTITEALSLL